MGKFRIARKFYEMSLDKMESEPALEGIIKVLDEMGKDKEAADYRIRLERMAGDP